ncbi:MAG: hypothetical protein HC866_02705 [Leptolyngbyaceae cyanobacterium RU_5_1]|nr:hypothetical protein [Leptolyngbyaceae cyanobacterium RU_5_1]
MTIAEIKQAIARHQQSLKEAPEGAETPERWEHLGAIAALETHLEEQLVVEVEENVDSSLSQEQE